MTAEDLLQIRKPEKLFPKDLVAAREKFRALAKEWHPDTRKHAKSEFVFAHIHALYDRALEKLGEGSWGFSGLLRVENQHRDGGWWLPYHSHHTFDMGDYYVGDHSVVYLVEPDHKDLFNNAVLRMKIFAYPSKRVEEECSRYLPKGVETMETDTGQLALVVRYKTPDLLLLRDVLAHFKEDGMDPKHVAWVISSLHNLSCYLSVAGLTHNDISLDTYFISPEFHSGALLGGWWFAAPVGSVLSKIPSRTGSCLPWEVRTKKKALPATDLELIRLLGRELLENRTDTPEPMATWLRSVATENAVANYGSWSKTLEASFGSRRFVKMDLNAETLYG